VQVLVFIVFIVNMEFAGAILRSFFGPLILVEDQSAKPLAAFTEKYRLIVFQITDFLVSMAFLYLFYS
jgi:hypothetical protein